MASVEGGSLYRNSPAMISNNVLKLLVLGIRRGIIGAFHVEIVSMVSDIFILGQNVDIVQPDVYFNPFRVAPIPPEIRRLLCRRYVIHGAQVPCVL